jgi:hypothetical protein
MDATSFGYGYIVPMPQSGRSELGNIVYIDEGGGVRAWGALVADDYFKEIEGQSGGRTDTSTAVETYPTRTAAFTTGCLEVRALTKDEVAAYVVTT